MRVAGEAGARNSKFEKRAVKQSEIPRLIRRSGFARDDDPRRVVEFEMRKSAAESRFAARRDM
jgi:hypothetical protein